jgi:hypothetical protein
MSARCVSEPISWLRLERHHLGELDAAEDARIAEHLAACSACAACLAKIREDDATALPVLTLPQAAARKARVLPFVRPGALAAAVGALAAAAAFFLMLRGTTPEDGGRLRSSGPRVKGAAVAFSLVRDDGERVDGNEGVYRDGDRFKALVTCPPGADVSFDVVVYDDTGATFPLDPAPSFACGNDVPLRGALRLTGHADETVCLVWSETGAVARETLANDGASRACKKLSGAREP